MTRLALHFTFLCASEVKSSHRCSKVMSNQRIVSEETKEKLREASKGNKNALGYRHTEETKAKIGKHSRNKPARYWLGKKRPEQAEENNPNWKGDMVGYHGLHFWVRKHLGKPDACEHCGKSGLTGKKIHWANKSGKYLRKITDWLRLCVSCHKTFDSAKSKK